MYLFCSVYTISIHIFTSYTTVIKLTILSAIARAERDGTCTETRIRLSPKRTSPFKSVGASVQSTVGSRGVRISLSNAGYTTFGGRVRVLATHSIRQFPLPFPSRASPCATRFRTSYTCCALLEDKEDVRWQEADHSLPSGAGVKNECSFSIRLRVVVLQQERRQLYRIWSELSFCQPYYRPHLVLGNYLLQTSSALRHCTVTALRYRTVTALRYRTVNSSLRLHSWVDSSWNVMAHGDAREGKRRGNWRMEWVASTLHTTSEHGVSSITQADAHTSAASSRLNWRPPPI